MRRPARQQREPGPVPRQAGPPDLEQPAPGGRGVGGGRTRRVVVVLFGGLGDQLFQWAFAETLRERGLRPVADTSRCRPLEVAPLLEDWPRQPAVLGLASATAYRSEVTARWHGYVVERRQGFDPDLVERAATGRWLVGGFRSLRYFAAQEAAVRREVAAFAEEALTAEGRALRRRLRGEQDLAAVVVRRGHLAGSVRGADRSVLPREYYERALTELARQNIDRRLWLSDDPAWVRANLAARGDLFVDETLLTAPAGRLALAAACRGRVLSDSTDAWWTGYLGRQPESGGVVLAPAQWFVRDSLSPADLLGPGWQLC